MEVFLKKPSAEKTALDALRTYTAEDLRNVGGKIAEAADEMKDVFDLQSWKDVSAKKRMQ